MQLVDYSALQRQVITLVTLVLQKKELIFEERLIIENAMNLWVGCQLYKGELFSEFIKPTDGSFDP